LCTHGTSPSCPPRKLTILIFSNTHRHRHLSIFSPAAQCGASIPYQQISIHAIKNLRSATSGQTYPSVYLQLELASGGASDDEFDTVELTLIPPQAQPQALAQAQAPPPPPPQPRPEDAPGEAQAAQAPQSTAAKLFEAISECSNLNPDPVQLGDEEEEDADADGAQIIFEGDRDREAIEGFTGVFAGARDGGLPPAFPGSGGWITAENVHEFFDEEGNWIGSEDDEDAVAGELGEGAGTVHARAEDEREVNGHGAGAEEGDAKRPRIE
jgi:hypothetical protein